MTPAAKSDRVGSGSVTGFAHPVTLSPSHPVTSTKRVRIGEVLLEEGTITEDQLKKALTQQKETGRLLGEVLVESGVIEASVLVQALARRLGYPVVVKPARQGSALGVSIVRRPSELAGALKQAFRFDADVLIEKFVQGPEITV